MARRTNQSRLLFFTAFCVAEASFVFYGLFVATGQLPDFVDLVIRALFLLWPPWFLAYLLWRDRFTQQGISYHGIIAPAATVGLAWGAADKRWQALAWLLAGFALLQFVGFAILLLRKLSPHKVQSNTERVELEENPFSPVTMWVLVLVLSIVAEISWYVHATRPLAWWGLLLMATPSILCGFQLFIHLRDRARQRANEASGAQQIHGDTQ